MPPPRQSGRLITSPVPAHHSPRAWYLSYPTTVAAPCIGASSFIPAPMLEHLLRDKKGLALGVKYLRGNAITNMEGVLHTYVVPVTHALIHGDYHYATKPPGRGHELVEFGVDKASEMQLAREVIVSAAVQPDFENDLVMMAAVVLGDEASEGVADCPGMLSREEKSDDGRRRKYDGELKRFMAYHLLETHDLPSKADVATVSQSVAMGLLEAAIARLSDSGTEPSFGFLNSTHLTGPDMRTLSLPFLLCSAFHQIRAELAALAKLTDINSGYIYTHDPPSIFARRLGGPLLTRIHIAALARFAASPASSDVLAHMKVYAFNDYADASALPLFAQALRRHPHISVVAKASLFPESNDWLYAPPHGLEEALLVLHNNSDAFGQNVEFEGDGGSLDGTIGEGSSAAASLARDRRDLLDDVVRV